jgi:hypothetical protein
MRHRFAIAFVLVTQATLVAAQTTSTTRLIPYAGTAIDSSGAPLNRDFRYQLTSVGAPGPNLHGRAAASRSLADRPQPKFRGRSPASDRMTGPMPIA